MVIIFDFQAFIFPRTDCFCHIIYAIHILVQDVTAATLEGFKFLYLFTFSVFLPNLFFTNLHQSGHPLLVILKVDPLGFFVAKQKASLVLDSIVDFIVCALIPTSIPLVPKSIAKYF